MSFRNFFAVRFVCRKKLGNIWSICSCFNQPSRSHQNRKNMKNTCSESPSCCFTVFLLIFVIIEKIKEAKGVALGSLSLHQLSSHRSITLRVLTPASSPSWAVTCNTRTRRLLASTTLITTSVIFRGGDVCPAPLIIAGLMESNFCSSEGLLLHLHLIYFPLPTITHPGCCLSCVFVKTLKVFLLAPPLAPLFPSSSPIILFAIGVLNHLRIYTSSPNNFSKYFPSQFIFFTFIFSWWKKISPLRWKKLS